MVHYQTIATETVLPDLPTMTLTEHSANHDRSVEHAMQNRANIPDDKSEEDDEVTDIPTLKTNTPKHTRTSPRIARNEPQYAGLYYSIEGTEDVLDSEGVCDVVHRDNCFSSTVDSSMTKISPVTQYLDRFSFIYESRLAGDVHPYAFSATVQTHTSINSTYKDIARLLDE